MRRRLYFILPDVESARRATNDLLLARIEDKHIHTLAKRGTDLGELHEATFLQKSDFVHGAEMGLVLGGAVGILAGILLVVFPFPTVQFNLVTVLITAIIGALFGIWAASLIGASTPNSRLKAFDHDMEDGHVLLMVDVPKGRIEEICSMLSAKHPEALNKGIEPLKPAFP